MIYIPACTLITSVDPARRSPFLFPPFLIYRRTGALAGKCKVQWAGKPQSLNNVRCVQRTLRENRPQSPVIIARTLLYRLAPVLFLTGLSFVIARPGSSPFAHDDPLHNYQNLPLDTCHRKTLLPASSLRRALRAAYQTWCHFLSCTSTRDIEYAHKRNWYRKRHRGKNDRRSLSNCSSNATLCPRESIVK